MLSTAADLPRSFADVLSNEAVDELVSERGLRTPFLRVAKSGSTLAEKAFTAPGGVGAGVADQVSDDKLVRLFAAFHSCLPRRSNEKLAFEAGLLKHECGRGAKIRSNRQKGDVSWRFSVRGRQ